MLLLTPALHQQQEQKQEQEQKQSQDQEQAQLQEQDPLLWNYFSTNLFVFLEKARPFVAQRSRSGRAFSLEKVQRRFRRFTPQRKRKLLL